MPLRHTPKIIWEMPRITDLRRMGRRGVLLGVWGRWIGKEAGKGVTERADAALLPRGTRSNSSNYTQVDTRKKTNVPVTYIFIFIELKKRSSFADIFQTGSAPKGYTHLGSP
jgi:hypothetical protein